MSCLQLRWEAWENLWDPWDGCGDGAEWCCGREDYGSGEDSGSATEEVTSEVHYGGGFFYLVKLFAVLKLRDGEWQEPLQIIFRVTCR